MNPFPDVASRPPLRMQERAGEGLRCESGKWAPTQPPPGLPLPPQGEEQSTKLRKVTMLPVPMS